MSGFIIASQLDQKLLEGSDGISLADFICDVRHMVDTQDIFLNK